MYFYDKCFAYGGGGFMYLAKSLIDKKLDFDSKVADLLYACPGCLACDDICEIIPHSEPYVRPFDIVRLMRNEAVKRGLVPERILKHIREKIRSHGGAIGPTERNNLGIPEKIYDKNADKVLFVERSFLKIRRDIYRPVLRILEKIGEPIGGISDGGLDFSELYDLGFWGEIEEYLTTKFDNEKMRGKEVIFINPHVQEFVAHRLPGIVSGDADIKTRHISEVLLDAISEGKLGSKKGLKGIKVSYHDPCYLGRGLNIYDPPREALSFMDGVELIEMGRNRRNSFCCGARAGSDYFRDFPKKTTLERLSEFRETGADLMITACPYCKDIFQKMMPQNKRKIVNDLTEFIEQLTE
jgi:Fe-S oxidoreductase